MKLAAFVILLSVHVLGVNVARASRDSGGSYVGNGGTGVACFDSYHSMWDLVANGVLTEQGRKDLKSVEPLEYYFAKLNFQPGSVFDKIRGKSFDYAYSQLRQVFIPHEWINWRLKYAFKKIGLVSRGRMVKTGLIPTDDAIKVIVLPEKCAFVQIVNTQRNQFYVDKDLWDRLSNEQKAILQLHEELYFIARFEELGCVVYKGPPREASSVSTSLLSGLLMTDRPQEDLPQLLEHASFEKTPDDQACSYYRDYHD